ncbi:MAG: DHHA1 domain-containing protein [Candidatus Diapherotrites archaeon]|nr:DHHA1 domain-containing protein [Candidatus Diapherotrites archaeon]
MGDQKAFEERLTQIVGKIRNLDNFFIVGNHDADGCTSTAIVIKALQRENKKVLGTRILKQLYAEIVLELKAKQAELGFENIIFVDLGSSYLIPLEKEFGKNFFVLDHHQVTSDHENHFNANTFGFSGSYELSASGSAYFFARMLNEKNKDLADLGIVGACGDVQDSSGKVIGLNREILEDGISAGVLEKKIDLRLYGRISRPLVQFLMFASSPMLPGLTGNEGACVSFLHENGIKIKQDNRWPSYEELSLDDKQKFTTALILYLHQVNVPEWKIQSLIGEVYTLTKESWGSPLKDAKEYGTILNACVTADTLILDSNGTNIPIQNFDKEKLLSLNQKSLKYSKSQIEKRHKIAVPPGIKLLELKTNRKKTLIATQNHEILSYNHTFGWHELEKLRTGDYVATLRSIPDIEIKKTYAKDFFKQDEIQWSSNGNRFRFKRCINYIKNTELNSNFFELYGFILGDGHLDTHNIGLIYPNTLKGRRIFKKHKHIIKSLFGISKLSYDRRPTYFSAYINGKTLVEVFNRLGVPKGKKDTQITLKKIIPFLNKKNAAACIRGLLESDGSMSGRSITYASHSKEIMNDFQNILLKFSINSTVTNKPCKDCTGNKYRLFITGIENFKKLEPIMKNSHYQLKIRKFIKNTQLDNSNYEIMPQIKNELLELKDLLGIPNEISSIFTYYKKSAVNPTRQHAVKFIDYFEVQLQKKIAAVDKFLQNKKLPEFLENAKISTRQFSQYCELSEEWTYRIIEGKKPGANAQKKLGNGIKVVITKLGHASNLIKIIYSHLESDLTWEKIEEIKEVNGISEVYDFTVDETHNYIANGIVVHNCARHENEDIALQVCLGNRSNAYDEALRLLANHRRELSEGLRLVTEQGVEKRKNYYYFDSKGKIKDSIIGIVAGMLYGSGILEHNKPIIAISKYPDGNLKISARASDDLVRAGLNLGTLLKTCCAQIEGAEGGGHRPAAGCRVPIDQQDKFLKLLEQEIENQLKKN